MSGARDDERPRLRPMYQDDVPEVIAIEETVSVSPWTAGIFADCIRVGYPCWVWELGTEVIGYGVMSVGAGEAHVLNIAVRPDHQRQGLGRRMMEHLIQVAGGRGAAEVFLEVRPSNRTAEALYLSMGFSEVGRRKDYYAAEEGREDAIVMSIRA